MIGKIKEVFIPTDFKDDILATKIGYKILYANHIYEVIQEQTPDNAWIFKNDLVKLTFKNNKIINLQLYLGEDYE